MSTESSCRLKARRTYRSSATPGSKQSVALHRLNSSSIHLSDAFYCPDAAEDEATLLLSVAGRRLILDASTLLLLANNESPTLFFPEQFEVQEKTSSLDECPQLFITVKNISSIDITKAKEIIALPVSVSKHSLTDFLPGGWSDVEALPMAIHVERDTDAVRTEIERNIRAAIVSVLSSALDDPIGATQYLLEQYDEIVCICAYAWMHDAIIVMSDDTFWRTFEGAIQSAGYSLEHLTVLAKPLEEKHPLKGNGLIAEKRQPSTSVVRQLSQQISSAGRALRSASLIPRHFPSSLRKLSNLPVQDATIAEKPISSFEVICNTSWTIRISSGLVDIPTPESLPFSTVHKSVASIGPELSRSAQELVA